jgi:hypothetical protein
MDSVVVRFPDGSKEFRFPERELTEDDVISHNGERYRVISVSSDDGNRPVIVVELISDALLDKLRSEEGAIRLSPIE